jgi:hypothetical protein
MQLRFARVCLDCEEVHDAQQCPVCASETFAFLTRWVPVDEQRRPRPVPPQQSGDAAESAGTGRWVKRGVAGVALLAAGQWLWRATRTETPADPGRAAGGPERGS